jgi:very-short-patch-repair endonuclease
MDKKEHIIRQIAKTNKKNYENYVVTRIINLINDPDLKFITQQPVILSKGKRALTDLYFPQIDFHIEIDEAHHKNQKDADIEREADIINATNHIIKRIDVDCDINSINLHVDNLVSEIKKAVEAKRRNNEFVPWDIEAEYKSETYIERGYIDLDDKVAFKRIVDACNCFGLDFKGYQRAAANHPIEKDVCLWFPKLYENNDWDNKIADDGKIIIEKKKDGNKEFVEKYLFDSSKYPRKRIVFARVKDSLGDIMYRFKGFFEVNEDLSIRDHAVVYERTATRVKTYSSEGARINSK